MDEVSVCREIISHISSIEPSEVNVQQIKIDICRKYGLSRIPKNSTILAGVSPDERERLRKILMVKPGRTLSGVAPVAVMTSPYPCPHGKCLPCPGGPEHIFGSPQSYTGEEPAALRAREHDYDPYSQVQARLRQFHALGHHIEKAELIVMGGTMTARPHEYQKWFVGSSVKAMNDYDQEGGHDCGRAGADLTNIFEENESALVRCIGITFETRPDWCREEEINRMLEMGVTKVELGVQQTDDTILDCNRRGCGVADTVEANRLLRDSGMKVGFHLMPNLPGSSIREDMRMFREVFEDPRFRPDFLKIYPTLVTPGSALEDLWRSGSYQPYDEDDMIDLVAYAKSQLPVYVRLQRVQRDIPAKLILAGSRHSNFRQLAEKRLQERGERCRCIRCREAGRAPGFRTKPRIETITYGCCRGTEYFISAGTEDSLVGFARLRLPCAPFRDELDGAALVRELHVYGSVVPPGSQADDPEWQHRNYGRNLLQEAEEIAAGQGYDRLAIMSGIGVRPYYRKLGYERTGPYMTKRLA